MSHFRDALGRKWQITIDVGAIKRVRDIAKFELLSLVETPPDGAESPLEKLRDDIPLLVDVLYAICEPQTKAYGSWWRRLLGIGRGITDEEFGRGLRGDSVERGWELIIGGMAAFFPTGRRRLLAAAAMEAGIRIKTDEATKLAMLGLVPPAKSGGSCLVWRVRWEWLRGLIPGANCR